MDCRIMETVELDLFRELSQADGIAGYEKEVSRVVKKFMAPYVDEIQYDHLGSIMGLKKGQSGGPKIMIAGHMDEVGFIVRHIDDHGFIRLHPIGRVWGPVLPSQKMRVTTASGKKVLGVIGSRAPHEDKKDQMIEISALFLDIGVSSKQEAENLGIEIGDMVTFDTQFTVLGNPDYLLGKAWDDRVGVAVLVDVLKALDNMQHDADIYAVGTVQEEVGIRGARTATHLIKPDIAIAVDVTIAEDTPFQKGGSKLGEGVLISVMDASTLGNRKLIEILEKLCIEINIPFRHDCMPSGGTDACNIHKSFSGVTAITLSIPTRYMHSSGLIIHKRDYLQTVKLIAEFCKGLDQSMLAEMKNAVRI